MCVRCYVCYIRGSEFRILARKNSLLFATTILADYPYLVIPAQLLTLGIAFYKHWKEHPFAEVGAKRAEFEELDPAGWSRGDKLEGLSLAAQIGCVILSAFCVIFIPNGTMSGVVAFLTIACVLAPVFYTVYILMDEYRAFKHGGGSSAIGRGRETTAVNSTDLAHDSPMSASSAAAAGAFAWEEEELAQQQQQEDEAVSATWPTSRPLQHTEVTANPLVTPTSRQRWQGMDGAWIAGQTVDCETEDGMEYNVTILGPSTSGDPDEMLVKFADGVVDDWPVRDFRSPISEAAIAYAGVQFSVTDDVDDMSTHILDHREDGDQSAVDWVCKACTYTHEGDANARFLSCEVCGTARAQPSPQQQQQQQRRAIVVDQVEDEDV